MTRAALLIAVRLPTPLEKALHTFTEVSIQDHLWSLAVVVVSVGAGVLVSRLVLAAIRRWAARTDNPFDDLVLDRLAAPLGWLLPIGLTVVLLPLGAIPAEPLAVIRHGLAIATILCGAWLVRRGVVVAELAVNRRFDLSAKDNLQARQVYTQMRGLRNIASFLIALFAVGLSLMTFQQVRQFGLSLLASAGVAGIIIGFAAQKSIATIVAGIQIAITQPVRLDDVVIVEGEWGRIEEITLTYVVVRIWDLRRLVLPITYFIEKPFQNWTRTSADLLGAVTIHADYTIPVDAVRRELERIVHGHEKWDGKVCNLQVVDASEHTLQLRALVSAPDSGTAWDLRCEIRERLLGFIQDRYPECLPRLRASLDGPRGPGTDGRG